MKGRNNLMATGRRSAGILMHISSLPGRFAIGDLGPEARHFADFLQRTHQRYWQLLPLNPVEKGNGFSPYSSISAFAGNTLLISPEFLLRDGLLTEDDLTKAAVPSRQKVSYDQAGKMKQVMLEKAFFQFKSKGSKKMRQSFDRFCKAEKKWLEDYALYVVLKKRFNKPWFQWPASFRNRNAGALEKFARDHEAELERIRWEQFVFFTQWRDLKDYCNRRGIAFFGDLPFYLNHDSADVWSARDIFSLDKNGRMQFVAGVPPDYFNANGQLWGMPVFRWEVVRRKRFEWWIDRIRKNIAMFDVLRLDHFRAFADYWAVPANASTAAKGKWKKGPGRDLFDALKKHLGELPFIAEDLGDIDDAVHALRKRYGFPGMKVLQFAFGDNFPSSDYLPHLYEPNFVAYTGTHDNNTTRGWYVRDAGVTEKRNVRRYIGGKVDAQEIHTLLIRLAYSSIARLAIIPMQDVLGLDQRSRMNSPATTEKNWLWRMKPLAITTAIESWLRETAETFSRT